MANWTGTCRTNLVKIADPEGLKASLEPFSSIDINWLDEEESFASFNVSEHSDYGSIYSNGYDEETDEFIEFSFEEVIMPHVAPNEILIYQEIGSEKLRYLTGYSEAFMKNEEGLVRKVSIGIDDIYQMAAKAFDVHPDEIASNKYESLPAYANYARDGRMDELKKAIEEGLSVEARKDDIVSIAAKYGQVAILQYMTSEHGIGLRHPEIIKNADRHPELKAWIENAELSAHLDGATEAFPSIQRAKI